MCLTKILIILFLLYFCENVFGDTALKDCSDCVFLSDCPHTGNFLTIDKKPTDKIKNSSCGIGSVNNKPETKVCCSDFSAENESESGDAIETHKNVDLLSGNCGEVNGDRIIEGLYPTPNEYPFMALLSRPNRSGKKDYVCAGSIINSKYILTSAHCVKDKNIIEVRIGGYNLTSDLGQHINVEKSIVHEEYHQNSPNIHNDIALLRLVEPINFSNEFATPICLPLFKSNRNLALGGLMGTVTGWALAQRTRRSPRLSHIRLPILSHADCRQINMERFHINIFRQFCATVKEKEETCIGDGGSPLFLTDSYNVSSRYIQYGIMSFGSRNCLPDFPDVYTDVTKYLKWILDNIEG